MPIVSGNTGGDCTVYVDTETECLDCPAYLVQEVLLGGGCISAFNVKFTETPRSYLILKNKQI